MDEPRGERHLRQMSEDGANCRSPQETQVRIMTTASLGGVGEGDWVGHSENRGDCWRLTGQPLCRISVLLERSLVNLGGYSTGTLSWPARIKPVPHLMGYGAAGPPEIYMLCRGERWLSIRARASRCLALRAMNTAPRSGATRFRLCRW